MFLLCIVQWRSQDFEYGGAECAKVVLTGIHTHALKLIK